MLSLETDGTGLARLAALMGQELFNPPNVAGWPGGPAWLSSGTWLARLNFANLVTSLPATGSPSGREAAAGPEGSSNPPLTAASDPAEVVDHLTEQLLDGTIAPEQRQVLIGYLTPPGGGVGGAGRGWLDERRRGVIYLSLAMPEYHLS